MFDDPIALERDEVATAVVFTTQSVQLELISIRELLSHGLPPPVVDLDPDGDGQPDLYTPQIVSTESLPFVLALPDDAGKQPFPVVILQHGHGGRKEWALFVAGYLAQQGIAVMAIDLVEHGERPDTDHEFLDLGNIPAIRANFEQCVADMMRLVQVVEAIAGLDLVPGGNGDGVLDLDPGKLALVGESAGAQVATMVAALDPSVGAVVVNVGGGGYDSTMKHYLGGLFGEDVILQLGVLVQTLFDRADPINFYRPYLPLEPGGPGIQILVQEVIEDIAMPNASTENLARVFECPLVRPYAREVEGLEIVDSPARLHGLFQFDPARHGFLLAENEDPEASDAVRRQVTSFLHAYFTEGSGVIENPW